MRKLLLLLAVGIGLATTLQAHAALIWGIDPSNPNAPLVNLNPATGAEIARYAVPGGIQPGDTRIGLAGWYNELFYTDTNRENGKVYVLNPNTGTEIRNFTLAGGWNINGIGYFANATDSYLYTSGCEVGDIHRYNAVDGAQPTFFWANGLMGASSIAGDNGGRIFAYATGTVYELDPVNNVSPLRSFAAPNNSILGMAFDGINIYFSDSNNRLFVTDANGNVESSVLLNYPLFDLASTEAVPEPVSLLVWSFLGAVAIGIGFWRRKRVA